MSNLDALPDFARTNKLKLGNIRESYNETAAWVDKIVDATSEDANLITSICYDYAGEEWHYPLLDLDFPAALLPSSTPGHFHLYIKKPMNWSAYSELLKVCRDFGIIQEGVYNNALTRKYTSLRMPHVKKGDEDLNHPFKLTPEQIEIEKKRQQIEALQQ